jgi:hypothetical protein
MRPYTTYKAFGAVLVVLSLPPLIVDLLHLGSGDEFDLRGKLILLLITVWGVGVFILSDLKIKQFRVPSRKKTMDVKAMLIFFILIIIFFVFVMKRIP